MFIFCLKLFFKTFAAAFTAITLLYMPANGWWAAFYLALYPALLYAVLMGFAAGTLHAGLSVRIAGGRRDPEVFLTKQHAVLNFRAGYRDVFDAVMKALPLAGAEITAADYDTGRIEARKGISLKCFGCRAEASLEKKEDGFVTVKISSRPRLGTTLLDYGENLKLVQTAATAAASELGPAGNSGIGGDIPYV